MDITILNHRQLQEVFADPKSFGSTMLVLLLDLEGTEALSWTPEGLEAELKATYGISMPEENWHKLQAAITCVVSDTPAQDVIAFNATCEALCGEPVDISIASPPDPDHLAWGVTEMSLLDPSLVLADEVCRYIGAALTFAGISSPPRSLHMAVIESAPVEGDQLDPDAYGAYVNRNQTERRAIDLHVRDLAVRLLSQINILPLQNRNDDTWKKLYGRLLKSLQASPATPAETPAATL